MKNFLQLFQKNKNDLREVLLEEDFQKIGDLVKKKRELIGISRATLSSKTRISVSVIEAIENAWVKQLPESTYLAKMLNILEKELYLKENSLKVLIKGTKSQLNNNSHRLLIPSSIEIFSTLRGTIFYFVILLISILLLNRQQRYISIKSGQTIQPIISKEILYKLYKVNNIQTIKGKDDIHKK